MNIKHIKNKSNTRPKQQWVFSLFLCATVICHSFRAVAEPTTSTESNQELIAKIRILENELSLRGMSKKERIKRTETYLHRLNNRHSWKKAAIGAVVTAAVTATPVGLVLGGLFGGFIGRSDKYNDIEEKISEMEQDIIVSEEDFLTSEEVRLEKFTHINSPVEAIKKGLSKITSPETEVIAITEPPPPVQATQPAQLIATYQGDSNHKAAQPKSIQEATANTAPAKVCYQGSQGRTRKSMSQCFYMAQ